MGTFLVNRLRVSLAAITTLCYCRMSTSLTRHSFSYLDAALSKKVDDRLMQEPGFSIDQLMELAGYSVAAAGMNFSESFTENSLKKKVLIVCGPGNNGGDGLVAARHLKHFGYSPSIVYPKQSKSALFANLMQQMSDLDIPISSQMPSPSAYEDNAFVVDALFGFSFQGPAREPFASMIRTFSTSSVPVLSVDVPSGWHVERGDVHGTGFVPQATISLTCPKLCMQNYQRIHYVGGRFLPAKIARELDITLPDYGFNANQFLLLSAGTSKSQSSEEAVCAMFVTASCQEEARFIAGALLEKGLAACVNLVPQVQSVYMWQGRVETSQEVLMMIKTRRSLADAVSAAVKQLHSYDVPESIALDVSQGSATYLDWVRDSTASAAVVAATEGVTQISAEELPNMKEGVTDACAV